MPGLLTAAGISRDRIERLVEAARDYRDGRGRRHPEALVGLVFFEDSLRTRVGFDAAAVRLRASTTTLLATKKTPAMGFPETLDDTVRSVGSWCDALCLRHPDADAVARAASLTTTPVINCGNGRDEHPTQALVDLFAIAEILGRVDGLRVGLVGDLDGMRAAHSLALVLSRFHELEVRCISPAGLGLPPRFTQALRDGGHRVAEVDALDVRDLDVLYVAGLPAPTRVGVLTPDQQARYRVTRAVAEQLPPHARILCPLPRLDEIATEVDELPQASYFRQSELAITMRMAILDEALGASCA